MLLAYFFKKVHIRDTSKVLIILSISFLLVVIEDKLTTAITFSSLIAVMFIGIGLQKKREAVAKRLSVKYGKLWVAAEVFLFVLVGATVNIEYLGKIGAKSFRCYYWGIDISNVWCICMSAGNKSSKKRAIVCYDGLYTKSNCSGCNWRNPACIGVGLWRYRTYCGGSCNSIYCTAGGICY